MSPLSGQRALGSRYVLLQEIGSGATGQVWRAQDTVTGQLVAAKILWEHHGANPRVLMRFVRERTLFKELRHPLIVHVHDFVVEDATLAVVMELVEGPSLAQLLTLRGPLPAAAAVSLTAGVLEALAAAHAAGVVHRDVKADNVLLADPHVLARESVRLADFGIARLLQEDAPLATETIGTPNYMAPELVAYGKVGPVSDVYSTGVLLYTLLAGRTPFAGDGSSVSLGMRHVTCAPPPLPVDRALWRVLARMLAKNPAHRLSAAETLTALEKLPAAALQAAALPPLAPVTHWRPTSTPLPSRDVVDRIFTIADLATVPAPAASPRSVTRSDPNRTTLSPTSVSPRRVSMVLPGQPPLDGGAGMRGKLKLSRAARRPPPHRRRRWAMAAAGVIGVGLLAFLFRQGFRAMPEPPTPPAPSISAARVLGDALPTGLRINLEAEWDPATAQTHLTVELVTVPDVHLTGEVLLVLPDIAGEGCAGIPATSPLQPVKASADGLAIPCGFKVRLGKTEDNPQRITTTVALTLNSDTPPASYEAWLVNVQATTSATVQQITGSSFVLQRAVGLTVEPTPVQLESGQPTPVPYIVKVQWNGEETRTKQAELVTSFTLAGQEAQPLLDLTGGEGLGGLHLETCPAARTHGSRVLATAASPACYLTARVGLLQSPKATYAIRQ